MAISYQPVDPNSGCAEVSPKHISTLIEVVSRTVFKQYHKPDKKFISSLGWKISHGSHKETFLDYKDRRLSKQRLLWIKKKYRGSEEVCDFKLCVNTSGQLLIFHFELSSNGFDAFCKHCGVEPDQLTEFVTFDVERIVYSHPENRKLKITLDAYCVVGVGEEEHSFVLALISEDDPVNWDTVFQLSKLSPTKSKVLEYLEKNDEKKEGESQEIYDYFCLTTKVTQVLEATQNKPLDDLKLEMEQQYVELDRNLIWWIEFLKIFLQTQGKDPDLFFPLDIIANSPYESEYELVSDPKVFVLLVFATYCNHPYAPFVLDRNLSFIPCESDELQWMTKFVNHHIDLALKPEFEVLMAAPFQNIPESAQKMKKQQFFKSKSDKFQQWVDWSLSKRAEKGSIFRGYDRYYTAIQDSHCNAAKAVLTMQEMMENEPELKEDRTFQYYLELCRHQDNRLHYLLSTKNRNHKFFRVSKEMLEMLKFMEA